MEEIISIADPERAKAALTAEAERRKVIKWTRKDGSLIDVKEMNDYHLQNAIAGENHEWTQMYPLFASQARQEGFESIAALFEMVAEIEKAHEQRFQTHLDEIRQGEVFSRPTQQTWVCNACGYRHEGTAAPDVCPVCGNAQAYFNIAAAS